MLAKFREIAIKTCKQTPLESNCETVVSIGWLYVLSEVQHRVKLFEAAYDKDHDGQIDKSTKLGFWLAKWEIRLVIWALMVFVPMTTPLQKYVEVIVGYAHILVTVLGTVLKVEKTQLLAAQTMAFALKTAAQKAASKAAFTSWITIFVATATPLNLISQPLRDAMNALMTSPVTLMEKVLGKARDKIKDKPKPKNILTRLTTAIGDAPPTLVTLALLAAWIAIGVIVDSDVKQSLEDTADIAFDNFVNDTEAILIEKVVNGAAAAAASS